MEKDQMTKEVEIYRKHISALIDELNNLQKNVQQDVEVQEPMHQKEIETHQEVADLTTCVEELCGILKNMQSQQASQGMQFQAVPGMFVSPTLPYLKTPDIMPLMPAKTLNNQNNGELTR